jgi:hypothetical protein
MGTLLQRAHMHSVACYRCGWLKNITIARYSLFSFLCHTWRSSCKDAGYNCKQQGSQEVRTGMHT